MFSRFLFHLDGALQSVKHMCLLQKVPCVGHRLLESDSKSLSSLQSGHSRKSSNTSLQSSASSGRHSPQPDDSEELWRLWGSIVNDWETYSKKKSAFLKEQVRAGVPHHFRGIVWQLLSGANECPARTRYAEFMKATSPSEKIILRDIARTYPEHEFFRRQGPGQEGLFNVIKAYSLYDREVGYCQGTAFIVGLLLLQIPTLFKRSWLQQMPEEEAFAVLVRLMEEYRLREMFKPTMADLGVCMYQLECLVKEMLNDLYLHLQAQGCHTSSYASSWFLTLFTSTFSHMLAARIMDLVLSEGMEMVFRMAIGILSYCKEDLLQLDMEGMLKYFQKDMVAKCEADHEIIINFAFQVKYNAKKMKKIEKDYTTLKIKEQEDLNELKRLRTENKIMRQRIEQLEQESSSLADRLVQGQVSLAKEAEDNYAIRRELAVLRQQEHSTQAELQRVYQQIRELRQPVMPLTAASQEDLVRSLQEELVTVKLREAENQDLILRLQRSIQELETTNKRLREIPPELTVAGLQEELLHVKLLEAEANLSQKDLKPKVKELQNLWKVYVWLQRHQRSSEETASPVVKWWENKTMAPQLQEQVKAAQASEQEAMGELEVLQARLHDLEEQ
ncbi:EVI5L, partial [Cordylochernes scorpioides]